MKFASLTVASSLRVNYERYLYPYELFLVKNGKIEVRGVWCVVSTVLPLYTDFTNFIPCHNICLACIFNLEMEYL